MRIGGSSIVVAAAGALVTGLVVWGAQDVVADDPQNVATTMVPPDGHRLVTETDEGGPRVEEDARMSGASMILTTPPRVGDVLYRELDGDAYDWRIWRQSVTGYEVADGESGEQSTTLYRLTDDGIEQLASYGAFTLVFSPPLLALPADARDGQTMTGEGTASEDGSLAYTYEASVETASKGCRTVNQTLDLTVDGEEFFTYDTPETWCPGRGVTTDDERPADPPRFEGSTAPQVPLAVGADEWVAHPRPLVVSTSVEEAGAEGGDAPTATEFPPAGTGDGGVTLANTTTGDVFGYRKVKGALVRAWIGHPGGDVTSVSTSGQVSVVGTSRRELVGYGERGQWLWSAPLGGVPVTSPLAVDEDHLVATTVAGDVVALDPGDGEELWRGSMTDQVRVTPVSDGELVATADVAGHLAVQDLDSGDQRWSTDLSDVSALAVVGSVLVVRTEYAAVAFSLADGTRLWSTRIGTGQARSAVVELGRTVAIADLEETVGLDRATGEVQWRRGGGSASLGVDSRLVQVDGDELTVRDDGGDLLNRLDLAGLTLPAGGTPFLAPADAGVFVMDGSGHLLEVSP